MRREKVVYGKFSPSLPIFGNSDNFYLSAVEIHRQFASVEYFEIDGFSTTMLSVERPSSCSRRIVFAPLFNRTTAIVFQLTTPMFIKYSGEEPIVQVVIDWGKYSWGNVGEIQNVQSGNFS